MQPGYASFTIKLQTEKLTQKFEIRKGEIIMARKIRYNPGNINIEAVTESILAEGGGISEKENWDIDFYMACMYNLRKGREGEESGFITGKSKENIRQIYPGDRAVMLETLKSVEKPIIAFKIFAGGQMLVEKTEEERFDRANTNLYKNQLFVNCAMISIRSSLVTVSEVVSTEKSAR